MRQLLSVGTLALLVGGFFGCEVRQVEEGRPPDVDVQVDPGKVPDYEVDAPEVEVQTEQREVEVPNVDVDINTERRTIDVPDVDVIPPDQDND